MSPFKRHSLLFIIGGIVVITGALAVGASLLVQNGPVSTLLRHAGIPRRVHVLGNAMSPTLKDGQYVDLDTTAYQQHPPQRGDIVVFMAPTESSAAFIKRVIAIPGERLRIVNSVVYVNDNAISEPYLAEPWTYNNNWPASGQDVTVPPDQYFVMGDNRNHSSDSRTFGFVTRAAIEGRISI